MDSSRGRARTILWVAAAFVALCAAATLVWVLGPQEDALDAPLFLDVAPAQSDLDGDAD